MNTKTTLSSLYSFPGFQALSTLKPHPIDTEGRIISLRKRQKKMFVRVVEQSLMDITTAKSIVSEIPQADKLVSILNSNIVASIVRGAKP